MGAVAGEGSYLLERYRQIWDLAAAAAGIGLSTVTTTPGQSVSYHVGGGGSGGYERKGARELSMVATAQTAQFD